MSDIADIRLRPPGARSRAPRAGQDHRLRRLPAHAAVQFADQHPAHDRERAAAVVHRRSRAKIPADRRGLARHRPQRLPGRECRTSRSARAGPSSQAKFTQFIYGFYPEPERWRVNLTFLLARAVAVAAVDSAPAGQGSQRRAVLLRISGRRVLPAAWRRPRRFRRELDRRHPRPDLTTASAMPAGHSAMQARPSRVIGAAAAGARQADRSCSASAISWLIWPLTWLRDQIQASGQPVWIDFAITAAIVSTPAVLPRWRYRQRMALPDRSASRSLPASAS